MVLQDYLQLLEVELKILSSGPYFRTEIHSYASETLTTVHSVIEKADTLPAPILGEMARALHKAAQFLRGSATNQLPYEMSYALELALSDCITPTPVVTTGLLADGNFFLSNDPLKAVAEFLGIKISTTQVHIGLPALFRHRPLMLSPLYHEVGHFVDREKKITDTLLLGSTAPPPSLKAHLAEHFADLFAACYIGSTIAEYLEEFAADQGASLTHPSTSDRADKIRKYLDRDFSDPVIAGLLSAAKIRGIDLYATRFSEPEVTAPFNDLCPPKINSKAEVHGLIKCANAYLRGNKGSEMQEARLRTIINDLTEKAIRDFMICEQWSGVDLA